jgi:hypothetical protein
MMSAHAQYDGKFNDEVIVPLKNHLCLVLYSLIFQYSSLRWIKFMFMILLVTITMYVSLLFLNVVMVVWGLHTCCLIRLVVKIKLVNITIWIWTSDWKPYFKCISLFICKNVMNLSLFKCISSFWMLWILTSIAIFYICSIFYLLWSLSLLIFYSFYIYFSNFAGDHWMLAIFEVI